MADSNRAQRLYEAVGKRIADARGAKTPRWTQQDLANRTGGSISRSALANMETGRQRISIYQLYEVASSLAVPPEALLPDLEEIQPPAGETLQKAGERDRAFVEGVRTASQRPSVLDQKEEFDR